MNSKGPALVRGFPMCCRIVDELWRERWRNSSDSKRDYCTSIWQGVIEREEFERKREELAKRQAGLRKQLHQMEVQAQQHVDTANLVAGIEGFCGRVHGSLDTLDFEQRRKLVELLIDCVIVGDDTVEIRCVVPTGPKGENIPFCHLRCDYLYQRP